MQDDTNKNRTVAFKLLLLEALLTGFAAVVLYLGINLQMALSVVLGGLAFIIPNAYFVKYVFRFSAQESPELALRGFYVGEVVKIFATVLIFGFGFVLLKKLNIPALIVTYIVLLIINLWGNSLLMSRQSDAAGETDTE